MVRAVVFDIDNTLYDFDAAHRAAYRALKAFASEAFSLAPGRFDALHASADALLKARCGTNSAVIHNRLIRYQLITEALGQPIAYAPRMDALYWSTLFGAMRPNEGLDGLFPRLHDMGMAVGIGTNMIASHQYTKLEKLGVLGDVDFMVSSEEACAEKPDPKLFALCAEKAGCPAGQCAYVGDSLEKDVHGAENAGMRAVWYRPKPEAGDADRHPVRIRSLKELPELLRTMF